MHDETTVNDNLNHIGWSMVSSCGSSDRDLDYGPFSLTQQGSGSKQLRSTLWH
jgi:hypothetical protein